MSILLIDNYDSFVFNLARYFERLGHLTQVVRHDAIDVHGTMARRPQAIVLSPGPCTPSEAGCSLEIVRQLHTQIPLLGICLGHQTIAAALGSQIIRAAEPMHGRTSAIHHTGQGILAGLATPFEAARYHSLVVDPATLPHELEITARTEDGVVMALRHRTYPVFGLQFHPESILTSCGYQLLANFLYEAGLSVPADLPMIEAEHPRPVPIPIPVRSTPLTF